MVKIILKKNRTQEEIEQGNKEFIEAIKQELITGKPQLIRLTHEQAKQLYEKGEVDIPEEQLGNDGT